MRQTILFLALVLFGTSSCMIGVQGNGRVEEQNRDVEGFQALSISGMFEVHLKEGDSKSIRVVADENLHELIETYVEAGRLHINTRETIGRAKELALYIEVENLEEIHASGAVSLESDGEIESENLVIESSGAAEIHMEVDAESLEINTSGAAEVEMRGKADRLRIETSGAAEIDLFELEAQECRINTSGAAEVKVRVEETLSVDASGAADIRYRGNPELQRTDLSGAASLKKD